jgi:hypothetical protein
MAYPNSLHSIILQKKLQVQVYNYVMLELLVTYSRAFLALLHTHSHTPKNIYNQLFVNYIHLILMPKVDICTLDHECVYKFQHYIGH